MSTDELLRQLLDDDPHHLSPTFRQWFLTTRRFRTFIERYLTKIRAKLRGTRDDETLGDLLFELEIARWLLQEKRFQLAYEDQGLRTAPGPDFTVSFTTKVQFHLEVTRIRATGFEQASASPVPEINRRKVLYVILGKLVQLKSGTSNVLVIGLGADLTSDFALDESMIYLKQRIAAGDNTLLAHGRFATPAAFFKQYHTLSAILFYGASDATSAFSTAPAVWLWLNKEAKYPLLTQIQTSLRQLSYHTE